ncbi:MAG: hypothetical protein IJM26_01120 [Lachnospiraceae bacterium]|nr:hypothetical protein [Lachnospiraceae bacterium]
MDYKTMLIYAGILVAFLLIAKLITRWVAAPKGKTKTLSAKMLRRERGPGKDPSGQDLLWAVFETYPEKEVLRLSVRPRVFRELPEGENGSLTYAGDVFLSFDTGGNIIRK